MYTHTAGAVMTFVFGCLYEWMQTVMSFKMHSSQLSSQLGCGILTLRALSNIVSTLCFLGYCIGGVTVCSLQLL